MHERDLAPVSSVMIVPGRSREIPAWTSEHGTSVVVIVELFQLTAGKVVHLSPRLAKCWIAEFAIIFCSRAPRNTYQDELFTTTPIQRATGCSYASHCTSMALLSLMAGGFGILGCFARAMDRVVVFTLLVAQEPIKIRH